MNATQTEQGFRGYLAKLHALRHALAILNYDAETVMPQDGAALMGETVGLLAEEQHRLLVSDSLAELLEEIRAHREQIPEELVAEARALARERDKMHAIPPEEFRAYSTVQAQAVQVWKQAKQDDDFTSFRPYLERLITDVRRFATYYDEKRPTYDVLLDENDKGLTMETLDPFFHRVEQDLTPLIREISSLPPVEDGFLRQRFPLADQRRLAERLLEILGIPRQRCALGESEHPFTEGVNNRDVRITTHYDETDMTSSLYSVLHEGGHALYMLNVDDRLNGFSIGEGAGTALHESQSRFFENMVGRSQAFLTFLLPELQRFFPSLQGIMPADLYRAVNQSRPSLIRIYADELTYPLHILIRYRLEKALFAGDLSVADLPGQWDELYGESLGVRPDRLATGVLQDTHWACGLFGYFPGYALGSAYSAQLFHKAAQDLRTLHQDLQQGKLGPLQQWLRERVWRLGGLRDPEPILQSATGEAFNPGYYTTYLLEKYRTVYGL